MKFKKSLLVVSLGLLTFGCSTTHTKKFEDEHLRTKEMFDKEFPDYVKKATPKPKVSVGSQFHQPPQLHSWSAHHEPKNSAKPFAVKIGIL
jgi:hypothetical protein